MKHILLVEDDPRMGALFQKHLQAGGFQVSWLQNSQQVEAKLTELPVDLVLLDHTLKGSIKSGLELLPVIRAALPMTRIWFFSNSDENLLREAAMAAGANDYLLKIQMPPKMLAQKLRHLFLEGDWLTRLPASDPSS